jgi:pyrimidine-nucleoside phosphorylase
VDALAIGQAAVKLGAGRRTKEDEVDPVAGLTGLKKPGEAVDEGAVLARLHAGGTPDLDAVRAAVRAAYTFSDTPPDLPAALKARYGSDGWTDL